MVPLEQAHGAVSAYVGQRHWLRTSDLRSHCLLSNLSTKWACLLRYLILLEYNIWHSVSSKRHLEMRLENISAHLLVCKVICGSSSESWLCLFRRLWWWLTWRGSLLERCPSCSWWWWWLWWWWLWCCCWFGFPTPCCSCLEPCPWLFWDVPLLDWLPAASWSSQLHGFEK